MRTLSQVMDPTTITRPDHLPAELEIPVLSGFQCQGDIAVIPTDSVVSGKKLPKGGWEVVRGEQAGNTHLLVGGTVLFEETPGELTVGFIAVADETFLIHPEHGANGIGPGTYEIRRQREMTAAGWRQVTD